MFHFRGLMSLKNEKVDHDVFCLSAHSEALDVRAAKASLWNQGV